MIVMTRHWVKRLKLCPGLLSLSLLFVLFSSSRIFAEVQDVVDTKDTQYAFLLKGDLIALKVYSLTRIAVSNPGIVDIANADIDEVLLIGRKVGDTPIFVWDELGKRMIIVRVLDEDLDVIAARIHLLLGSAEIEGIGIEKNIYEGRVVLTGKADSFDTDTLEDILEPFRDFVINLVTEEESLIQIDVQVSELSTSLTKALGVNWTAGQDSSSSELQISYEETLPEFGGEQIKDLFKLGRFDRTSEILATVNALILEGKGRILSKPSIIVSNGEEAKFLVGGEIPIRTTSTSTGGTSIQENVTFTSYGIDLQVTPEIDRDQIDLEISVNIRDIDAANAVGENVAFTTRTAETQVLINSGQPIVIAGMIKHNQAETVKRVPLLGSLPLVGGLFRTKNWSPNTEQEVVVSLTPRIVRQEKKKKPEISHKDERAAERLLPHEESFEEMQNAEPKTIELGEMEEASFDKWEDSLLEDDFPEDELFLSDEDLSLEEKLLLDEPGLDEDAFLKDDSDLTESMEDRLTKAISVDQDIFSDPLDAGEDLSSGPDTAWDSSDEWGALDEMEEWDEDAIALDPSLDQPAEFTNEPIVAGPPAGFSTDDNMAKAITTYVQSIQRKISNSISFPYEAKIKGWEGTAVLTLVVLNDGSLQDISVKESSGHDIFDKDAINTTQILAPFDPFPVALELDELVVTIPIIYSQKAVLDDLIRRPHKDQFEHEATSLSAPSDPLSVELSKRILAE